MKDSKVNITACIKEYLSFILFKERLFSKHLFIFLYHFFRFDPLKMSDLSKLIIREGKKDDCQQIR